MAKMLALAVVGCSLVAGCAAGPPAHAHDPSDHNHDRGHMMVASDGWVDALLTAHLSSATGHELDVFVERSGAPLALPTTSLRAVAVAGGAAKTLEFTCAPPGERPEGEAPGTCSHFVARAGWLEPRTPVVVGTQLPLRRGEVAYVWRGFEPARYAHHVE